jgi:serine/threonine protein kinase
MPLTTGTKLGPYEIQAPLGAGGMGEVYRARDTRLGREVAVKVLPASFAADPERLRRFEQEARATAALNHPNLLAIFDIGNLNGAPYVVSELLEGETLRERLRSGAAPVRKAIEIAVQLAHGLAAAHEKNIVHRDLKPENIFLTADGRVKILDFGLAKLQQTEGAACAGSMAITAEAQTDPGTVLGTMGYMSPEQLRGAATDARADIFSFGAVLYEMLSGRRAFHGTTAADTISAILKEDPPDLVETNRNISPALERIVRHCLEKRPEQRFHSARDVAFDLEALSATSGSDAMKSAQAGATRNTRAWIYATAAVALIAAGFAAGWFASGRRSSEAADIQQLTFRRGSVLSAAFAPDGRTVVYTARWEGAPAELFTTSEQSPESRSLEIKDAMLLAISSSGELAVKLHPQVDGVFSRSGTLATVPLTGGSPRALLEHVDFADWSPDGSGLAVVQHVNGEYSLQYPIGKKLFTAPRWISHLRFSPSGKWIAFLNHPFGGDEGSVMVTDLDGKVKELSKGWVTLQGLAWSPDGKEIWFTGTRSGANRALYAVTLEGKERLVQKTPGLLTVWAISPQGRVLVTQAYDRFAAIAMLPGAKQETDLSWFDASLPAALSDDGKLVLLDEVGEGGGEKYATYLRSTDGAPAIRLSDGAGCSLSGDGKYAIALALGNPSKLLLLPTTGTPEELNTGDVDPDCGYFVPGGKKIVFAGHKTGQPWHEYLLDNGAPPKELTPEVVAPVAGGAELRVSTDGKYAIATTPAGMITLYPLDGGPPQPLRGAEPGEEVNGEASDGHTFFVSSPATMPRKVFKIDSITGARTFWKDIAPHENTGANHLLTLYISHDGEAYIYCYELNLGELYLIRGLK